MTSAQEALDRTVTSQVQFILNPLSHDHSILRGFVDEGAGSNAPRNSGPDGVGEIGKRTSSSSSARSRAGRGSAKNSGNDAERLLREQSTRRHGAATNYREEVYTDKDRAAAVNMGSKDIKQSLKMKGRDERGNGYARSGVGLAEEIEPSSLLVRALQEMRWGHVDVALASINQALELSPKDKNALIARCKCYLLLGEPQKALKDAETILEGEPKDSSYARALYYKAEALYHLGSYEMSLVYYCRGQRMRPELDHFRLGAQKATNAIRRLLGRK